MAGLDTAMTTFDRRVSTLLGRRRYRLLAALPDAIPGVLEGLLGVLIGGLGVVPAVGARRLQLMAGIRGVAPGRVELGFGLGREVMALGLGVLAEAVELCPPLGDLRLGLVDVAALVARLLAGGDLNARGRRWDRG